MAREPMFGIDGHTADGLDHGCLEEKLGSDA
jgi:hypothetical protein